MNATVTLVTSFDNHFKDLVTKSGNEFLCTYVFDYFPKVSRDHGEYKFTFGFKRMAGGRKIKMKTIFGREKYFANRELGGKDYYSLFESFVVGIQELARENSIKLSEDVGYSIWVKIEESN